jgi:hypothetical protein
MEQKQLSPLYLVLICIAVGLTVLSGVVSVAVLLIVPSTDPGRAGILDSFSTTWKIGFGAIIGLIGGKVT